MFFQIPVNVFEGDDEVPEAFVFGEWEVSGIIEYMNTSAHSVMPQLSNVVCFCQTLRDLMGDEELEDLDVEFTATKPDRAAEEKKRKLEEEMRRELEERKRKKMELLKKEKEVEMVTKSLPP